jgi:superfamily I DNA/RNA helicase
VYSLKVQDYETYVADGIITHNSIYGFSGSDPQSLPNLVAAIGAESRGVRECPLTVTFRCPRSHVELARKIVPQIEAAAAAIDGTVATIEPGRLTGAVKPGDLVVCRVNAPLVSLAFKLIRAGVPAKMLGRDIGKGQVTLIDQLRADSAIDLIHKARDWQERETARLERRDAAASRIQAVADRAECLIELASAAPTVSELRRQIDTLFADQAESGRVVTLASVHRAKGSEADRVFIAPPDRMPLRFDGDRRNGPPKVRPWELEQEFNLLYVAVTRAKKELTFAGPMPSVLCS